MFFGRTLYTRVHPKFPNQFSNNHRNSINLKHFAWTSIKVYWASISRTIFLRQYLNSQPMSMSVLFISRLISRQKFSFRSLCHFCECSFNRLIKFLSPFFQCENAPNGNSNVEVANVSIQVTYATVSLIAWTRVTRTQKNAWIKVSANQTTLLEQTSNRIKFNKLHNQKAEKLPNLRYFRIWRTKRRWLCRMISSDNRNF